MYSLQRIPEQFPVSILRLGRDHRAFGDPYEGAATTLLDRRNRELIVLGLSGNAGTGELLACLKSILQPERNISQVSWTRHVGGKIFLHQVSLDERGRLVDRREEVDRDPFI